MVKSASNDEDNSPLLLFLQTSLHQWWWLQNTNTQTLLTACLRSSYNSPAACELIVRCMTTEKDKMPDHAIVFHTW